MSRRTGMSVSHRAGGAAQVQPARRCPAVPRGAIVLAVIDRNRPVPDHPRRNAVHLRAACIASGLTAAAVLTPAAAAWADTGGTPGVEHLVYTETSAYPGPGDDPNSFYGIFRLDGACGFPAAQFAQSDTENFYITQHDVGAADGDWQARAIIDDEAWSFVAEDADHNPVTTFKGTADEHTHHAVRAARRALAAAAPGGVRRLPRGGRARGQRGTAIDGSELGHQQGADRPPTRRHGAVQRRDRRDHAG